MKKLIIILSIFFSLTSFSQEKQNLPKADWNGYIQLRATSNFDNNTTFMLRRLKFWVKSTPDFSKNLSYKVQVLFTSWMQEKFFLQDALITYKIKQFSFDIGQFTPRYSLQWTQPDYQISAIERANVINILFPNGTLGIRDLGVQVNFYSKNKLIESSLGLFNGYGIKEYRFSNSGYMITHRTALNFIWKNNAFKLGYSIQFREAEDLQLKYILPDSVSFTGQDFRYNLFVQFKAKYWEIQAEYLSANLNSKIAHGFYVLSTVNLNKNQFVMGVEQYKDLIDESNDKPYYRIGYNYLINKNKIKVFFSNFFQINKNKIENYYASVQIQIFFK